MTEPLPKVPVKAPVIAYFVHDLTDAAVRRRVMMMHAGDATVRIAGFCRAPAPPPDIADVSSHMFGLTRDGALAQRAVRVAIALARPSALAATVRNADVIVARNLEMLVLARRARLFAPGARLVYESLDIHRSLLGSSFASRVLRWIERRAMKGVDLLVTSSRAFEREYFDPIQNITVPVLLVENKLLVLDLPLAPQPSRSSSPPWTIGWFGNLRCKKSLAALRRLAIEGEGRIQLLIAGKPSDAEFPDFASQVADSNMRFVGPYSADQLPGLYAQCHFAWAIDYFEEGQNSSWLLPNRLYEAVACGAIPIALADVATGEWLARHNAGLLLSSNDVVGQLLALLSDLEPAAYAALHDRVSAVPRSAVIASRGDCIDLVEELAG